MEDAMLPEFHNIFTTKHYVAFEIFGNKIIVFKWGKKLFQSGANLTTFYFKVGQVLFQKGIDTGNSKWEKVYFKVGQLLQSGKNFFSKCGSYFKVGNYFEMGHNIMTMISGSQMHLERLMSRQF